MAPSAYYARLAQPPPAAYALRRGDLNNTNAASASYTSDPFVLVQFTDKTRTNTYNPSGYGMAIYSIVETDTSLAARTNSVGLNSVSVSTGEIVITATAHGLLQGEAVEVNFTTAGGLVDGLQSGNTYYVIKVDANSYKLAPTPGGPAVRGATVSSGLNVIRQFPYTFEYRMLAGRQVVPPYPLGPVIGLSKCSDTFGRDGHADSASNPRVYWEDYKDFPWAVSAGAFRGYFYYPMRSDFWWGESAADLIAPGRIIRFLPTNSPVASGATAVRTSETNVVASRLNPQEIKYNAAWPDNLPVLKVGETLTFAGGEYKTDNTEAPGLPGVVGWAAGRVVFDSLNPTMDTTKAFDAYAARLVEPLSVRSVPLVLTPAQKQSIGPATAITEADGLVWRFKKLSAALQKRIYYDPLNNTLNFQGYLNDKKSGDASLTETPPPLYILEPNILTLTESNILRTFVANDAGDTLYGKLSDTWHAAVTNLVLKTRNPAGLIKTIGGTIPENAYYSGLEYDAQRDTNGNPYRILGDGSLPAGASTTDLPTGFIPTLNPGQDVPKKNTARPMSALGPGLALVPSPHLLIPANVTVANLPQAIQSAATLIQSQFKNTNDTLYVTLAENDNASIGGPVSLYIVKLVKQHRFRGAIKTVPPKNIFAEQMTLRHSGDFGANIDDLVYEWYYRADSAASALIPNSVFDVTATGGGFTPLSLIANEANYSVNVEGRTDLLLPDNWFLARYRHKNDVFSNAYPSVVAGAALDSEWARYGSTNILGASGLPAVPETWAGAANSPTLDGYIRPQLVMGWLKRVMDRINLYEARFSDFRNNPAPATYVSMIQSAGQRYEGPVALNPDKNVIENLGLIELYETLLNRARTLSIDTGAQVDGVQNALQFAATRIQDLYMLLANEAYSDAQDPTVGFGSASAEYGSRASSIWAFMNQTATPLEEELALLRGISDTFGRPAYNRLFWNFTKDLGEVAYAQTYNLSDYTGDGFVDENDARLRYPQGHGDAWGHYTTAVRKHYGLLTAQNFRWQPRAENYNLLDVVVPVDFYDERKFARAAAARAKTGADIVSLTYRSSYLDSSDARFQGYKDTDSTRAWGVAEWARRAGQAALFDWATANSLIPTVDLRDSTGALATNATNYAYVTIEDSNTNGVWDAGEPIYTKTGIPGIQRVDRMVVSELKDIPREYARIENTLDDANSGLNPLGLAGDLVSFDIDPIAFRGGPGATRVTHFEQVYERARGAVANVAGLFDQVTAFQNQVRRQQDTADALAREVQKKDAEYRNRLITIFGSPHAGNIGPGKPYPAGYNGPDLFFFMYSEVTEVSSDTVPRPPADNNQYTNLWAGFQQQFTTNGGGVLQQAVQRYFLNDLTAATFEGNTTPPTVDTNVLALNMPITASGYAFQTPAAWGRRSSPGELQSIISSLVQAETDLALAIADYQGVVDDAQDMAIQVQVEFGISLAEIAVRNSQLQQTSTLERRIRDATVAANTLGWVQAAWASDLNLIQNAAPDPFLIVGPLAFGGNAVGAWKLTASLAWTYVINILGLGILSAENTAVFAQAQENILTLSSDLRIEQLEQVRALNQQLHELEGVLGGEGASRLRVFRAVEVLRQVSDSYSSKLSAGFAVLSERQTFNQQTAGAVQELRYQDVAFRVFRNEALEKYRAAFDLAARYAFMAAKAYDYETNLDPEDSASAQGIFEQIMRARTLGVVQNGQPSLGNGLADALARMKANFAVLVTQMGLNNAQTENSKISLRYELFRITTNATDNSLWRDALTRWKVPDLWQVPEFRRYCRPFVAQSATAQPGLVIPFGTEITAGKNTFGRPLGGADHAFDPTLYANKVDAVGVWFTGYDYSTMPQAPRIYLVPAGLDVMTIPTSASLRTRTWNVVDQRIPTPFAVGGNPLGVENWIPSRDWLDGPMAEIRKYSSFRAYGASADVNLNEMTFDSRLVGRSVWNTRWMLIIPGITFNADPSAGVDKFIGNATTNGVTDIKLVFKTFGFSGN